MMKRGSNGGVLITIALIVVIIAGLNSMNIINVQSIISGTAKVDEVTKSPFCGDTDGIALVLSSQRTGAAGTQPPVTHRLFVDGIDKGNVAEDSSTTVSTYTDFVVYFGENSTNGYYTVKVTDNSDCTDPFNLNSDIPKIDKTPTCYFENDDGTLNSASDLSIDSGESVKANYICTTTEKEYYGNPTVSGKNVIIISYNTSAYEEPKVVGETKITMPGVYSEMTAEQNNSFSQVAYTFPLLSSSEKTSREIIVDAKDGKDPSTTTQHGLAGIDDLNITLWDIDIDLDADDLSEIVAIEDEDDNNLGATGIVTTALKVS